MLYQYCNIVVEFMGCKKRDFNVSFCDLLYSVVLRDRNQSWQVVTLEIQNKRCTCTKLPL